MNLNWTQFPQPSQVQPSFRCKNWTTRVNINKETQFRLSSRWMREKKKSFKYPSSSAEDEMRQRLDNHLVMERRAARSFNDHGVMYLFCRSHINSIHSFLCCVFFATFLLCLRLVLYAQSVNHNRWYFKFQFSSYWWNFSKLFVNFKVWQFFKHKKKLPIATRTSRIRAARSKVQWKLISTSFHREPAANV